MTKPYFENHPLYPTLNYRIEGEYVSETRLEYEIHALTAEQAKELDKHLKREIIFKVELFRKGQV